MCRPCYSTTNGNRRNFNSNSDQNCGVIHALFWGPFSLLPPMKDRRQAFREGKEGGYPTCPIDILNFLFKHRSVPRKSITFCHERKSTIRDKFRTQSMIRKGKGKVLPITGHEGPRGEQMYSSTLYLTFRNRASYIQDGHTATLQTPHFIYFFNKYTYWIF